MSDQQRHNKTASAELNRIKQGSPGGDSETATLKRRLSLKQAELARIQAALAGTSPSTPSASPSSQQLQDLQRLQKEIDSLEQALLAQ
jgi:hypothetical protein